MQNQSSWSEPLFHHEGSRYSNRTVNAITLIEQSAIYTKTAIQAVKKGCGPQKSKVKRYEIQGGGQEMTAMVG